MAKSKLKFSISPLLLLVGLVFLISNQFLTFLLYMLTAILHEFGHYIVASKLGYSLNCINLLPFGVCLKGEINYFKNNDEFFIAIAGPIVNIVLIVINIVIWWFFPNLFAITFSFVYCNILILIVNLLPVYPLDGGRIVVSLLSKKYSRSKVLRINKIWGLIIVGIFTVLFVISAFFRINYSLIIFAIFLLISLFNQDKEYYYESICKFEFDSEKINGKINIKAINQNIKLNKIIKLLKNNSLNKFIIVDNKKNIIKELVDDDIKKFSLKIQNYNKTIKELIVNNSTIS